MLRRRRDRRDRPDPRDPLAAVEPARLGPPWRGAVESALAARARFVDIARRLPPGPVQERLGVLAGALDAGVVAAWETAVRGDAAAGLLASLDPDGATADLKAARRRLDAARQGGEPTGTLEDEVALLASRHAAVHRLWDGTHEAGERLRLLGVRLDAAVARAATLVLAPGADAELAAVESELSDVVGHLTSLHDALAELGR